MGDMLYGIWLTRRLVPGKSDAAKLFDAFGSAKGVYEASDDDVASVGISASNAHFLRDKSIGDAVRSLEFCQKNSIRLIDYASPDYPAALKDLSDPPCAIYVEGELPNLATRPAFTMVGTRRMSEYGMRAAYKTAFELAAAGGVVVSGLAIGIDAAAAVGALCGGGETLAVLGCGIDRTYPSSHADLRRNVALHGAVISEFPPGTPPEARNFPIRNRIMSALGQSTVVIEADEHSGALITARESRKLGRRVFALPGNVDSPTSVGTNALIKDGATMVLDSADILEDHALRFGTSFDERAYAVARSRSEYKNGALEAFDVTTPFSAERKSHATHSARGSYRAASEPPRLIYESEVPTATVGRHELTDAAQRKLYDAMPSDRALPADKIEFDAPAGEKLALLSMLEIYGYVSTLPGGLYKKL